MVSGSPDTHRGRGWMGGLLLRMEVAFRVAGLGSTAEGERVNALTALDSAPARETTEDEADDNMAPTCCHRGGRQYGWEVGGSLLLVGRDRRGGHCHLQGAQRGGKHVPIHVGRRGGVLSLYSHLVGKVIYANVHAKGLSVHRQSKAVFYSYSSSNLEEVADTTACCFPSSMLVLNCCGQHRNTSLDMFESLAMSLVEFLHIIAGCGQSWLMLCEKERRSGPILSSLWESASMGTLPVE